MQYHDPQWWRGGIIILVQIIPQRPCYVNQEQEYDDKEDEEDANASQVTFYTNMVVRLIDINLCLLSTQINYSILLLVTVVIVVVLKPMEGYYI